MKVVKAAAQVLNTLWQYRELRNLYKQVRTCTTSNSRLLSTKDCSNSAGFGASWLPRELPLVVS